MKKIEEEVRKVRAASQPKPFASGDVELHSKVCVCVCVCVCV